MQVILGNRDHPEYGVATIPFPIPREEYDHCIKLLDALEMVLRDVARVQAGLEPIDVAIEEELSRLAERFTFSAVACIMEETASVRKRLSAHVQWRSAAEPLLLKIVEG